MVEEHALEVLREALFKLGIIDLDLLADPLRWRRREQIRLTRLRLSRQLEVPRLHVIANGGPVSGYEDGHNEGHEGRGCDHRSS